MGLPADQLSTDLAILNEFYCAATPGGNIVMTVSLTADFCA